jgi:hypothetical protein
VLEDAARRQGQSSLVAAHGALDGRQAACTNEAGHDGEQE